MPESAIPRVDLSRILPEWDPHLYPLTTCLNANPGLVVEFPLELFLFWRAFQQKIFPGERVVDLNEKIVEQVHLAFEDLRGLATILSLVGPKVSDTSEDLKNTFVRLVIGQVRRKVGGVGAAGVL